MTIKEKSEKTICREVCELGEPIDQADTWTRVSVNGNLKRWVPHDDYGEMMAPSRATGDVKSQLESIYQNSQ